MLVFALHRVTLEKCTVAIYALITLLWRWNPVKRTWPQSTRVNSWWKLGEYTHECTHARTHAHTHTHTHTHVRAYTHSSPVLCPGSWSSTTIQTLWGWSACALRNSPSTSSWSLFQVNMTLLDLFISQLVYLTASRIIVPLLLPNFDPPSSLCLLCVCVCVCVCTFHKVVIF